MNILKKYLFSKSKNILGYCRNISLLILPLLFVFIPFVIWLLNEYYDYNKENLVLWTSFIPILSYVIGLLIGVIHQHNLKTHEEQDDYD